MAAIDNITELAQDVYFSINGAENDDTDDDQTTFQNNFIRAFNLWLDEYETETYWNQVRENDYELATIANTTTYSFELPDDYRMPVINRNQYLKIVNDGTVIARFKMVDPSQRTVDDDFEHPDRATFVGRNIVLSRKPTAAEVGSTLVLDVVLFFPKLTRTDDSALDFLYNKQIAVLGIAKNQTLADVTKSNISPSFGQKYKSELDKAIALNNASNAADQVQTDDFSHIGGIW